MKILKLLLYIFILALFCFCSDNDDAAPVLIEQEQPTPVISDTINQEPEIPEGEEPEPENNGFTFDNQQYITNFVYINDENNDTSSPSDIGIIFSDKDILNSQNQESVNFTFFDVNDISLQQGTYSDFTDYRIYVNSPYLNGVIQPGVTLFDDNEDNYKATASSVIIESVTQSHIILSYTLTRTDGKVLQGYYSGPYINVGN